MAPVNHSPSDHPSLSFCKSTESRGSTCASVSTASLLHNAGIESSGVSFAQISSAASNDSEVSVSMAQCNKILANYRQEDVVYALMTHLKEREGELKRITEQRNLTLKQKQATDMANQQLQGALAIQRNLLDAKEKTIQSLEHKLEKVGETARSTSHASEDKVMQLTEEVLSLNQEIVTAKQAHKGVLADKDNTICELKSEIEGLVSQIAKADRKKSSRYSRDLEEQVEELETKLGDAEKENAEFQIRVEDLEKQVKRKDWIISSLKQENEDQRHREDNLLVHVRGLQQTIDTYESRFMGKGIDVPIVLAKLQDAETRNKELVETLTQMGTQMSAMRTEGRKHGLDFDGIEMEFPIKDVTAMMMTSPTDTTPTGITDEEKRTFPPAIHDDIMSIDEEDEDADTATLNSILEPHDPFGKGDRDDLSLLIQDVRDGIEDIQNGGLCRCACSRGFERAGEPLLDIDAVISETFTD
ncbi:hypothetical protein HJC23_005906 [Cyclotella cryptica]|uniref:Uncharacterized protein n=1 Tax=Cyclotella cryptica TaxID=29204 RepID=A0ABD3QZ92_9STRA|eukprot:CCRYP_000452-RA/>CCRYP_000452-RA protein AED:0.19 eAED:0.19 QI:0/-1/0/1/-1/1/1/0/471